MTKTQIIMLVVMVAYLIFNVVVGMLVAKKKDAASTMSQEKKYFIGSRGMSGLVLAMTTVATYTSVSSFISGPGAAGITYGYSQAWVAAIQCGAAFLVMGVLGNKMAVISRRTGAVSIAGYLKARYRSDAVVIFTSLVMVVFFIVQMVAQFTGGAALVQTVTGLPYVWSLAIFAVVVIGYTSFGGFTAVVITDTIQGIIMVIGTFLFLFYVFNACGGMDGINAGLQANLPTYADLTGVYPAGTLLSYWVLVGAAVVGLPQTAVRGMGFKNTKSLKSAMVIGTFACTIMMIGMHVAGTWAGALLDKSAMPTSDYMVPMIVGQIMPAGIGGLFMAAPLAAVMSTVSSLLILASATILKDLYKTYVIRDNAEKGRKFDRNFGKLSFGATLLIGLVTMYFSVNPPDIIFLLNVYAMGGIECAFVWPIVGGVFYRKGNAKAALASAVSGVAMYVFAQNFLQIAGINPVVWGLLLGGIVYFAVGAATCRNGLDREILETCF